MNTKLQLMARSNNTILIMGKTGTGKSYLAKQIHELSNRKNERFVAINLATLSENLIESELFGHERGSFSGADAKRIGKLEWANRGTVFLDEIGELPLHVQSKLLEALNSRTISPVGSNREIQLDIRIITATNRSLVQMVASGKFREDLFYRINGFEVSLPDLQGNHGKIESLARKFASDCAADRQIAHWEFGEGFLQKILLHSWPGNLRELKNTIEYAFALSSNGVLLPEHLPPLNTKFTTSETKEFPFPINYRSAKEYFERMYLQQMLWKYEGKINQTAKETGLSKVTLIEKIRRFDINIPEIKYQTHQKKTLQGVCV